MLFYSPFLWQFEIDSYHTRRNKNTKNSSVISDDFVIVTSVIVACLFTHLGYYTVIMIANPPFVLSITDLPI